jgi:hypothetical protein
MLSNILLTLPILITISVLFYFQKRTNDTQKTLMQLLTKVERSNQQLRDIKGVIDLIEEETFDSGNVLLLGLENILDRLDRGQFVNLLPFSGLISCWYDL